MRYCYCVLGLIYFMIYFLSKLIIVAREQIYIFANWLILLKMIEDLQKFNIITREQIYDTIYYK